METSPTIAALAAALVKTQASVQPAAKDKTNPAFRSRYADLASVWDACRQALTDNGLCVVQVPEESPEGRIALTTMLLHESGEFIRCTFSVLPMKNDPQGAGSALTYLRRYALAAMVGVVSDDDDDGGAASQPPRRDTPKPAATKPPTSDRRPRLLSRIAELSKIADGMGLEIVLNKPLDKMTEEELIQHGQSIGTAIDQATPAD